MLGNEKEQFQNFEILMEDITFDNGVFASSFECFTVEFENFTQGTTS